MAAAFAFCAAGPAAAAPALHSTTVLKGAAVAPLVTVSERTRRDRRRAAERPQYRPDNVGSIIYDGVGYGYNSRTGERYMSCMIDEGYGRVTPCDNGNGGGGLN